MENTDHVSVSRNLLATFVATFNELSLEVGRLKNNEDFNLNVILATKAATDKLRDADDEQKNRIIRDAFSDEVVFPIQNQN